MGKALHAYDMIKDGDRIAVGLSGGKDSWALIWLLAERLPRVPVNYALFPIHIDLGFGGEGAHRIENYARTMGWPIRIERTDIGLVAHSDANRENPCFLCARRRRQLLFEMADDLGCNKIALGHNKDDIVETFFLNMFYAGEMSTMQPRQPFFQGRLTVIRPLAYTDEVDVQRFSKQMDWPIVENPCPSAGNSKRAVVKAMLERLCKSNDKIKGNIFRAMRNIKAEYQLR